MPFLKNRRHVSKTRDSRARLRNVGDAGFNQEFGRLAALENVQAPEPCRAALIMQSRLDSKAINSNWPPSLIFPHMIANRVWEVPD